MIQDLGMLNNTSQLVNHLTSDQISLLVDTSQRLSQARDLDSIKEIVRNAARDLTGADGATFVLKENGMCYYAEENAISPLWKGRRFPMSTCISGWVMMNQQPAVIEDIYQDERIPNDVYKPTFVKSLAMVPIRTRDPIGAIGNYWANQYSASDQEVHLLQSLADLTSVSLENVYINQELEERIQERTKQLEFANKELEAFNYSVSHDLRSPLRTINGYAKILTDKHASELSDDAKKLINYISNDAVKMSNLIDDLLTFSKKSRKEVETSKIDMNGLINHVLQDLNNSMDHETKIETGNLHSIWGDYNMIYHVMSNLIANAVKFTANQHTPDVQITSEEGDNEIVISVSDNGAGFDMKYADRLFDVFQRLHPKDEFQGSGVGLALVQRIIHKHGGSIWAEAQVDEGAAFHFSLPIKGDDVTH